MADLLGQQFGNYRLIRLLGQGGFAEVYLGEHVRLGMKAAIKVLQTHLLTEQQIDAFQHEARTVAELTHPHIVRVLDFDLQDGRPFLVLDYAPNGSLQKKHPRGSRVPLDQVVSYVQQVASALDYAHTHKLIHRDVKPENLLIGKQEEILLSDFGIVTLAHATSSMNTEAALGTLAYMAPEQIQGKPRKESDQYALAVAVYHWLGGRLPFEGSSAEIIAQHLGAPPPPLRTSLPELPAEVESVVLTALAKDPAQRFGSVQAFARAFTGAFGKASVSSPLALDLEAQVQPPEPVSDATTTQQAGAAVVAAVPGRSSMPPALPAPTTPPVPLLPPTVPASLPEQKPGSRKKQVYITTLVSLAALLILSYIVNMDVSQMHVASVKATATSDAQNAQNTVTTGANVLATRAANIQATATADVQAAATADVRATAQTVAQNPYPSYMSGKGTLVLLEPLDGKNPGSGWGKSSNSKNCQFQDNALSVTIDKSQNTFSCDNPSRVFGNFTLEVQAIIYGNCGGVSIRGSSNHEYVLSICSDGIYRIDRFDNATSDSILTHGSSSWIDTGFQKKNTLGIVANGSTMQLYVNGHLVASATDGKYSRGDIGLIAYDAGTSTWVDYTNMRIWV